jgi:hypothetical protein
MRIGGVLCVLAVLGVASCTTTSQSAVAQRETSQPAWVPKNMSLDDKPLREGIFYIHVYAYVGPVGARNVSVVRAAEITLGAGYSYFRILDSWGSNYDGTASRYIIVRLTEDPNDMDAQWILDTVGPDVGYN